MENSTCVYLFVSVCVHLSYVCVHSCASMSIYGCVCECVLGLFIFPYRLSVVDIGIVFLVFNNNGYVIHEELYS